MNFSDRVVIVTGSGGGIGEGYAKSFARSGMRVAVAELDAVAGQRVVDEILDEGGQALFVETDVSDASACNDCARVVFETWGRIDFLVNNAAIFGDMRIEGYLDVDMDYLDHFMAVNMNGCLLMTRAVFPYMKESGGSIVNQSSTAAWMNMGFYGVAKLAMNGITCSLARELGPWGIRINAIAPGPTDTQALHNAAGDQVAELVNSLPLSRLGTPEDLAEAVKFLLSEKASWITGHVLNVDGGHLMRA